MLLFIFLKFLRNYSFSSFKNFFCLVPKNKQRKITFCFGNLVLDEALKLTILTNGTGFIGFFKSDPNRN
jgi:hypothetical protein